MRFIFIWLPLVLTFSACNTAGRIAVRPVQQNRSFESSFERVEDFDGFFLVPQGGYASRHELSRETVHDGEYAHKAWIVSARAADNDGFKYLPHRAYPTIQPYRTAQGRFVTPCLVGFWAYLDMTLADRPSDSIDDWFSFATLSPDSSDRWRRTVLVNLAPDGYLRLVHVPDQGRQEYLYQADARNDANGSMRYPYRKWVKIDIYIDFSPVAGYAKLWQDGVLVSHARVDGGNGTLAQAHFGLYASAAIASGTVYNDKLSIREVPDEETALRSVQYGGK